MDTGELALVVLSVAAVMGVVGLLFALGSVIRAMSAFRQSVQQITSSTLPLIADMHAAIKQTNAELLKVDALLDTAESISSTVDSASRLAYTAFSNPLVKLLALGSGTAKAVRRFRAGRARDGLRPKRQAVMEVPARRRLSLPRAPSPAQRAARAPSPAQRAARAPSPAQRAARALKR